MIQCPNCKKENQDDNKFCCNCGTKLEPTNNENSESFSPAKYLPVENPMPILYTRIHEWIMSDGFYHLFAIELFVFFIGYLLSLFNDKMLPSIFALMQLVLVLAAYFDRNDTIQLPGKNTCLYLLLGAWALALPFHFTYTYKPKPKLNTPSAHTQPSTNQETKKKEIDYYTDFSTYKLVEQIPTPPTNVAIAGESSNSLTITCYKMSTKDYEDYKQACYDMGYNEDIDERNRSFVSYNDNGDQLSVTLNEYEETLDIHLTLPKTYGQYDWDSSNAAFVLPEPKSKDGKLSSSVSTYFEASISQTTRDDYKEYRDTLKEKGFTLESSTEWDTFNAKNQEGYKVQLSYTPNHEMSIKLEEPIYDVDVTIACLENLVFSRYNVNVIIDGSNKGTLPHGSTERYTMHVKKGTYKIQFESSEDKSIIGQVILDIHQNDSLIYKLHCTSTHISVITVKGAFAIPQPDEANVPHSANDYRFTNYQLVEKSLRDAGFTNITYQIDYDIIFGIIEDGDVESVSINNQTIFEPGTIFKKDAPIVITYHKFSSDNPDN